MRLTVPTQPSGPRAGGLADQVVRFGDVSGSTGGICAYAVAAAVVAAEA